MALRPFFIVTSIVSFMSLFSLHFMQCPVSAIYKYLIDKLKPIIPIPEPQQNMGVTIRHKAMFFLDGAVSLR